MTHRYKVSGMTCTGCQAKVGWLLGQVAGVQHADIDLDKGEAKIAMDRHVPTPELQQALAGHPKYKLEDIDHSAKSAAEPAATEASGHWISTYKPVLLIGGYVLAASLLTSFEGGILNLQLFMERFMAGFFLTFSFFKLLDLNGFADSYAMYDVVARRVRAWGFIYPFVELGLGLAFLTGSWPLVTNWITLAVMTISLIGVLQSVLNRKTIKCACLGTVFNLPMSTITIIEDGLMILMSAAMLISLLRP